VTSKSATKELGLAEQTGGASAASPEQWKAPQGPLPPPEAESAQPAGAEAAPEAQPEARPVISVVAGRPEAEELAALVAVLSALGGGGETEPDEKRSPWSDPAWRLSGPQPRRGGWRSSGLPR
jgi:hypothetical protein